jgi:hypothetical protein
MNKYALMIALFSSHSYAQSIECEENSQCISNEEIEKCEVFKEATKELVEIKSSESKIVIEEPIIVIRDWQDRVYINGGENKPIPVHLTIGETIDREMEMVLPIEVGYRDKPPDPMFRLRIRAQAGLLIPETVLTIKNSELQPFWDAQLALDFFHIDWFNTAVHLGVRSTGAGLGIDLTKNFGSYVGYALTYEPIRSSVFTGVYFSFN